MSPYPADLARRIAKEIEGEVRFDRYSRVLYSTDASVWQIEPIGAVIPRHHGDVRSLLQVCSRHQVPVLPRGGATSLSGQTVGHAVHVDFAKYMNGILETNLEEEWVRVQPGVVQDQLGRHLRPLGYQFGPNTSSASRGTVGGMIGNNSAGSHSIVYGKTIDHVLELRCVFADGSEAWLRPVGDGELEALSAGGGFVGSLYRELPRIGAAHREAILDRFPKILRRVSGYNLDELVVNGDRFGAGYSSEPGPLNLSRVIVGCEGTLAVVTEAKLRIVRSPSAKGILVVHFRSVFDAVEAAEQIVATGPSAAELIDEFILGNARANPSFAEKLGWVEPSAQAVMVVEYYGESQAEVASKLERLGRLLESTRTGYGYVPVTDPARQAEIWAVRKEALGILMSVKGDHKPIAFVEDPAVPIEAMGRFLKDFRDILDKHDAHGGYYGHASVGCLHVRPMINLKEPSEVRKMAAIADEVFGIVMNYGGSMSGEHGDGIARSRYNQWLFGEEIYKGFLELKKALDPQNILNPGKVVNAPEITEDLRWGESYRTLPVQTKLDFAPEGGFARSIEMCNGAGVCRKRMAGTMCPSYHATLDEEHSTRGRANALRAALSGALPPDEFTSHRMHDVLDLCLACKACKTECPSNVDMAKIKSEWLAHYHDRHGVPLAAKAFGRVETLYRWGSKAASVVNWAGALGPVRWLNEQLLHVDRRRSLPPFARQTFREWFGRRVPAARAGIRGAVVLLDDCFLNYNYPQVGRAAVEILEAAGFEVRLADKRCCGRPMLSKGLLGDARSAAEHNIREFGRHAAAGTPIVGCEPSCLLTLRDEYIDLVPGEAAKTVAEHALMLDEFLVRQDSLDIEWTSGQRRVLFHGHCHQKAQIGSQPSLDALRLVPGLTVEEVNSGCCGMAGSFGFEKGHYEISRKIGAERLFPAVEAADPETEIAVSGVSCRQQIDHFTGRRARHTAEVLRDCLGNSV
ncbi:MAG: anaerobic glycerol-3-phosphate dehydrogenase subunit C [Bryobacterales bacterium]|nr:anaerobic glycerol-3-phosphate dehydrogenase subunit C [Bryobacterales bacterium]